MTSAPDPRLAQIAEEFEHQERECLDTRDRIAKRHAVQMLGDESALIAHYERNAEHFGVRAKAVRAAIAACSVPQDAGLSQLADDMDRIAQRADTTLGTEHQWDAGTAYRQCAVELRKLLDARSQAVPQDAETEKPKPDSADWWRGVAQGLGVQVFDANQKLETLRITAVCETIDSLERGGWLSAEDAAAIRATLPLAARSSAGSPPELTDDQTATRGDRRETGCGRAEGSQARCGVDVGVPPDSRRASTVGDGRVAGRAGGHTITRRYPCGATARGTNPPQICPEHGIGCGIALGIAPAAQPELICPFCREGDFDAIGLKFHLLNHCDAYDLVNELAFRSKVALPAAVPAPPHEEK